LLFVAAAQITAVDQRVGCDVQVGHLSIITRRRSVGSTAKGIIEWIYRDARLMNIGEGTSEIQSIVIARHVLAME